MFFLKEKNEKRVPPSSKKETKETTKEGNKLPAKSVF